MELGAHLMAANQSKEDMKTTQASVDSSKERLLSLNERIEANAEKVVPDTEVHCRFLYSKFSNSSAILLVLVKVVVVVLYIDSDNSVCAALYVEVL